MEFNLSIDGDELEPDFDAMFDEVLKKTIKSIERRTPVKTGKLQAGWQLVKTPDGYNITNTQDYVGYVEFGTAENPPVGMVRTSIEEMQMVTDKECANLKFK